MKYLNLRNHENVLKRKRKKVNYRKSIHVILKIRGILACKFWLNTRIRLKKKIK